MMSCKDCGSSYLILRIDERYPKRHFWGCEHLGNRNSIFVPSMAETVEELRRYCPKPRSHGLEYVE